MKCRRVGGGLGRGLSPTAFFDCHQKCVCQLMHLAASHPSSLVFLYCQARCPSLDTFKRCRPFEGIFTASLITFPFTLISQFYGALACLSFNCLLMITLDGLNGFSKLLPPPQRQKERKAANLMNQIILHFLPLCLGGSPEGIASFWLLK